MRPARRRCQYCHTEFSTGREPIIPHFLAEIGMLVILVTFLVLFDVSVVLSVVAVAGLLGAIVGWLLFGYVRCAACGRWQRVFC